MAAGHQIEGQMNAFDFMTKERKRPCEYDFIRYTGQRVCVFFRTNYIHGTVTAFDDYYTEIRDDAMKEWVGTPTNTIPEERWEQNERNRIRDAQAEAGAEERGKE